MITISVEGMKISIDDKSKSKETYNNIKNNVIFLGKTCIFDKYELDEDETKALYLKEKKEIDKTARETLFKDIGKEIKWVKEDSTSRTYSASQMKELEKLENLYKNNKVDELISEAFKTNKTVSIRCGYCKDDEFTMYFDMGSYSGNVLYGYCDVVISKLKTGKYDGYCDHSD